ncbi:LysR family transcriptional regulator [Colwelliaceae bacterium BS250]
MINQTWLKTFCTLAEVGHFTQTAERLFMTQSGVSQHIKKLEHQLATDLLIRDGKSFSLTEAGIQLNISGQKILRSMAELELTIKQDEQYQGIVRVMSPGSIGLKLYPYLLDIQQQYPNLIFNYEFSSNKGIEQSLIERKVDIALMTEQSKEYNIISNEISAEPLVLVTSHNVNEISWQTLMDLGFIAHPDAVHHSHSLLSKNFNEFEHVSQFQQKGFSNQISLILEPVSRGFGFTILPLHAVTAFHQQQKLKIHHLENSVFETLYLCHNRSLLQTNRVKYVKSLIAEYINE